MLLFDLRGMVTGEVFCLSLFRLGCSSITFSLEGLDFFSVRVSYTVSFIIITASC